MNRHKLKTMKKRLERLMRSDSNNFNMLNSLDDIGVKASNLLLKHEKYKIIRDRDPRNTILPGILDDLLFDYHKTMKAMDMFDDNKQIMSLKKSLDLNLKDLYRKDVKKYLPDPDNRSVPSMSEINRRFRELTQFSNSIRKKRGLKK